MKRLVRKWKKWFSHLKYREKLKIILEFVGLFPIIILGCFTLFSFRNILSEKEYDTMRVSLNQTCSSIEKQSDIYKNLENYIVYDKSLRSILSKEQEANYDSYQNYVDIVDPLLNTPKFYHDGINRVTIYAESIVVPHDTTLAPLKEIEDKEWFDDLQETEESIWIWPDKNRDEILLIRKFPGMDEQEAYLGIYCNMDDFIEPLQYFERVGAGIFMFDEEGSALFSKDEVGIVNVSRLDDMDKDAYQYVGRKIEDMPISVGIFMYKGTIYSSYYRMLWQVFLVLLCSVLVIILSSYYMSRIAVRRIEKLTESVNQIEVDTMKVELEDDSPDEIGILIRSFRKMIAQIQSLIKEVYQSKIKQQNLEMKALQAQINPHFLYNTLSLINWKAITAGEEDISTITLALSDFYRTTLSKGKSFITTEDEMKNIRSYLNIQLIMHDNEFQVQYDIDPDAAGYYVPKLLLQPLVENALEHGLDVKEEGNKELLITCHLDEKNVLFTVQDNGVGMDNVTISKLIKTHSTGYGVNNVNDRLVLLYGEEYMLHIESRLGVGTKVSIRIPKTTRIPEEERDEKG
ncbi:MAG: sensor histidine kinase [Bariatricus sp.]|nr:sensor histidine kinase [Bariatricus sp.]